MAGKSIRMGGGSNDPIFVSLTASGADDRLNKKAENPYSMTLTKWTRSPYRIYYNGVLWSGPKYVLSGVNKLPDALSSNEELALLSKVTEKIRGHDFNLGIFVAEGKQSLETVGRSSLALARLFKNVCTLNVAGTARAIAALPGQIGKKNQLSSKARDALKRKDVSGAWLAIQYGWLPLITDIYEAMRAYENMTAGPREIIYRSSKRISEEWNDAASPGYLPIMARGIRTVKYKIIFREQLSANRSLGLLNPLSVVWEKVPWSFVVDWFIPVGNYLDVVSFLPSLKLTYVRSEFAKAKTDSLQTLPSDYTINWIVVGSAWRSESVKFTRTVGTSLNIPKPSLKSMEKAFSTPHLRNTAALVHQVTENLLTSSRRARR